MSALMRHPVVVQARREFWEHGSLWIAPLIAAGLLFVGFSMGPSLHVTGRFPVDVGSPRLVYGSAVGITAFLGMVTGIVLLSYLLDCLYAERKDRSILFWKSLPVSDLRTVLVKLVVALLVVPSGVWLLGLLAHLTSAGVMALRGVDFGTEGGPGFLAAELRAQGRLLATLVFAALWYAPVATYLMLASVVARRAPLMIAALPLLALMVAESVLLDTNLVRRFIGERLLPSSELFGLLLAPDRQPLGWATRPDLWLGLVAAAGILYWVVRLRRYRDDT